MALGSNNARQRAREIHQQAWESLPWYANGTLEGAELELVENHVSACVTCRSELKFLQGLGLQIHSSGALDTSAQHGLSEIMSRIDKQQDAKVTSDSQPGRNPIAGKFANLLRIPSAALPRVLGAQAALIALLVGLIVVSYRSDSRATFRTLSDPAPISQGLSTQIRVLFVEQASEKQIRELLLEQGAQIVAGPSPLGVYTVALTSDLVPAETEKILDQFRSRAIVRFADRSTTRAVSEEAE